MRDQINNNPIAQMILIGVLVVAGIFIFISSSGGGSEEEEAPTTEATVTVAGSGVSGTATGATPGEAVEGAVEEAVTSAAGASTAPSVVPTSVDTPKPPADVIAAYKADKTVVLLIVHDGGIDDHLVSQAAEGLRSMSDVALFVVPASQIYRYAAITLGVEVSRVPALIVMRPRNLSDGTPQATVTYGFQSSQNVVQAVRDASYKGPDEAYHPN